MITRYFSLVFALGILLGWPAFAAGLNPFAPAEVASAQVEITIVAAAATMGTAPRMDVYADGTLLGSVTVQPGSTVNTQRAFTFQTSSPPQKVEIVYVQDGTGTLQGLNVYSLRVNTTTYSPTAAVFENGSLTGVDTGIPQDGQMHLTSAGKLIFVTTSTLNGVCGAAAGSSFTSKPTTGLCGNKMLAAVRGAGPWTWSCPGTRGGTTAMCEATVTPGPVNGACGTANGIAQSSMPTTGLCAAGTAMNFAGTGPWSWSCAGSTGGATASCSAPLLTADVLTAQVTPLPSLPSLASMPVGITAWYVDTVNGSDTNNGLSKTTAFKTIARATYTWKNKQYKGGDVVVVMPGTYNETVRLQVPGSPNAYTILMGMPGLARPVIVGNVTGQFGNCVGCAAINIWAPYTRISGIDASAPDAAMAGTAINAGLGSVTDINGVVHPNVHHVIIDNNNAHDSSCGGIGGNHNDYYIVENNIVYNNSHTAPNQCSGISLGAEIAYDTLAGYHNQVINNISYNNVNMVNANYTVNGKSRTCNCHTDGNGIIIDSNRDYSYTGKTLIFGNIAFDNGGRGIHVYDSDNVDIINNTTYFNGKDSAITSTYEFGATTASNVNFANNIGYALTSQKNVVGVNNASNVLFRYNDFYNGLISIVSSINSESPDSTNLINTNPVFVLPSTDPKTADFHLQPVSKALKAGAPLGQMMIDILDTNMSGADMINMGALQE